MAFRTKLLELSTRSSAPTVMNCKDKKACNNEDPHSLMSQALDTLLTSDESLMSNHLHSLCKDGDVLKFIRQFQLSNSTIGIPPLILIHLLHRPPCAVSTGANGPQLYGVALYHDFLCGCDTLTPYSTHSSRIIQCVETGCNMQTVYNSGHYAIIAAYMQFFGAYRTFCHEDTPQLQMLFGQLIQYIRVCELVVWDDHTVVIHDLSEYTSLSALTKMQLLLMFVSFEFFTEKLNLPFQDVSLQREWLPFVLIRMLRRCNLGEKYPVFSTVIKESLAQGRMMPRSSIVSLLVVCYHREALVNMIVWLPSYQVVTHDENLQSLIKMFNTYYSNSTASSQPSIKLNLLQYSNKGLVNVVQPLSYVLVLDCDISDMNIQDLVECSDQHVWLNNTIPAAITGELLLQSLLCFFP